MSEILDDLLLEKNTTLFQIDTPPITPKKLHQLPKVKILKANTMPDPKEGLNGRAPPMTE